MRKYKFWLVAIIVALIIAVILVWANLFWPKNNQPFVQKEKNIVTQNSADAIANNFEEVLVTYVIDGDTVILRDGRHVRYIGIDTPELESGENVKTTEYEDTAEEALKFNQQLVLGKKVILEKDVEEFDKYGRTLAYVWVDGIMVGEELLRNELAFLMTIPPNTKHEQRLKEASYRGF